MRVSLPFWKYLCSLLAVLSFSASAQTYDDVKRRAREVNARQVENQNGPAYCGHLGVYQPEAESDYARYKTLFPGMDERARSVARSFYQLSNERMIIIENRGGGRQVRQMKSDDISQSFLFNAEVKYHFRSNSRADYANNAIVERFTAVYYLGRIHWMSNRGQPGAVEKIHSDEGGVTQWRDHAQHWGISCRDKVRLSAKWSLLQVSVGIRADGQKTVNICIPSESYVRCWDGEKPTWVDSEDQSSQKTLEISDFVKNGAGGWRFSSLYCPDSVDFEFGECRLRWSRPLTPVESYKKGLSYISGEGGPRDLPQALDLITRSAEQDYVEAQELIGSFYYDGEFVGMDRSLAAKWYERAVRLGSTLARYRLGKMYAVGDGVSRDSSKALQLMQEAAERNYVDAQIALAIFYETGEIISKDDALAIKWYEKAADGGSAFAQVQAGRMYSGGSGLPLNIAKAVSFYKKAAQQGNENALNSLRGLEGNAVAESVLGDLYYAGRGVRKDIMESVKWYRMAAEKGNASAQNNLGFFYSNGLGVPKNLDLAAEWFRKAAEQGLPDAVKNLAATEAGLRKEKLLASAQDFEKKKDFRQALQIYGQLSDRNSILASLSSYGFALATHERSQENLIKSFALFDLAYDLSKKWSMPSRDFYDQRFNVYNKIVLSFRGRPMNDPAVQAAARKIKEQCLNSNFSQC